MLVYMLSKYLSASCNLLQIDLYGSQAYGGRSLGFLPFILAEQVDQSCAVGTMLSQ